MRSQSDGPFFNIDDYSDTIPATVDSIFFYKHRHPTLLKLEHFNEHTATFQCRLYKSSQLMCNNVSIRPNPPFWFHIALFTNITVAAMQHILKSLTPVETLIRTDKKSLNVLTNIKAIAKQASQQRLN